MVRMTKAQRACLQYVQKQGGTVKLWPAGFGLSRATIKKCAAKDWLRESRGRAVIDFISYQLTPAGIAALAQKDAVK